MDPNNLKIQIKQNDIPISPHDNEGLLSMIIKMAYETEDKELHQETVSKAIDILIKSPEYGYYLLIYDTLKGMFCAMDMVTFEFNIHINKTVLWLQSVYVEKDYRMQGLFRKLLEANQAHASSNLKYDNRIKLYMDKNNQKAEQVYFKVGFKVTDEILYEIDYSFDDISFINEENKAKFMLGPNQDMKSITSTLGLIDCDFKSLITNTNVPMNNERLFAIEKILKDDKLGTIICVTYGEKILALFTIFFEFSDWRNSVFWWVYDFLLNTKVDCNLDIPSLIYNLVKLNHSSGSCGLRFMTRSNSESLMDKTVLLKSHYIIFEKEL